MIFLRRPAGVSMPGSAAKVMQRMGTMPEMVEIGKLAPDFRLPAQRGGEAGPGDVLGKQALALFFVREFK